MYSRIRMTYWTLLAFLTVNPLLAAPFTNGGFESGALPPWFQDRVFSSGEDWNVTNSDAHTGTFSATNTGNKEIRQNFDAIPTDDIVELSFGQST